MRQINRIFILVIMITFSLHCVNAGPGPYKITFGAMNISIPSKFMMQVDRSQNLAQEYHNYTEMIIMVCQSTGKYKKKSCYDEELGIFIEFDTAMKCQSQICYALRNSFEGSVTERFVNFKAATMVSLREVITTEHMINEELRHNFGLVVKELEINRFILTKTILSLAKIDDNLLGTVLNDNVRSHFLAENLFSLIPRTEFPENTNCIGNKEYKMGRWRNKNNYTSCINGTYGEQIELFKPGKIWVPEIVNNVTPANKTNLDGWSYYAEVQNNQYQILMDIKKENRATKELIKFQKTLLEKFTLGLFITQIVGYVLLMAIIIYLNKKINRISLHIEPEVMQFSVGKFKTDRGDDEKEGVLKQLMQQKSKAKKARNVERQCKETDIF